MAFKKTEAVVIKAINVREADKILTFFSREYGKIQGIARGVRKIRTKYSGKLELFNRVEVIFFQKIEPLQSGGFPEKPSLLGITQVDSVETFPQFQSDFHRMIGASYIAELLNRLFEDYDDSHKAVYTLVCQTFRALATLDRIQNILPAFELKLLAHLGYAPVFTECTVCQRPRTQTISESSSAEQLLGFNFATGGVLCPRCKAIKKGTFAVSSSALNVMQQLMETAIVYIEHVPLTPELHQEVKPLLSGYLQYHLGVSLKTDAFVQKLRSAHFSTGI
ncbi:MAG: DNA repair protein RecO [Candidatus Vecturithrix sp.]|jgi:DNA repair protein RecO (recombination protein O)|nr:DNA repair protein RecO [Candidatus Vecturithrix sp.]